MTVGDIIFIVEALWQQADIEISLDQPTILLALNETLQQDYPIMLMADDSFWVSSQAVSGVTTLTYPSNFRSTVAIAVPAADGGGAREVSYREWQTVINNTVEAPTSTDPIYRNDATGLVMSPAITGTHYYLRTIPEVTSKALDLFSLGSSTLALCPWTFQESLILGTLHLLALREAKPEHLQQSEVERVFKIAERWKEEYELSRKPLAVYKQDTQVPRFGGAAQ